MKEKINLIREHTEDSIAALNAYLDKMYELTDKFFNEKGELLENLKKDKKLESFLIRTRKDTVKYEEVRKKLINKDFSLTLKEINLIALSFLYCKESWKRQIESLQMAIEQSEKLIKELLDKES